MQSIFRKFSLSLIILTLLLPISMGQAAPSGQAVTGNERAQALLDQLTPEERIGQLFLVTFIGPEAGIGSATGAQIYDLIVNYHIGGVILTSANDNFIGSDQTLVFAQSLTDQLQRDEYSASQETQTNPETNELYNPAYIPLFIGISQEGDGFPYDQILNGMTPLPSQMALGATWSTDLSQQVGSVLGKELSGLGFNLLLGPSLDVLEVPTSDSGGDLGVRTFGGDPFWVGALGQAYIRGVHEGSNGKMVVAAKHFPGFGGSDRLPEDEVATVRSSLEQLKQIDLAPFFAVTGNAPDVDSMTDALLVSHIRYQGFQGNIRATTRPVSFDPQAFSQLMSLPAFDTWRQNGGVMISDNLGSRAVRRFYDPSGQTFNGPLVARDAFLAGNDLLYLDNFLSSGDPDVYSTYVRTLVFFAQKYREDPAFAQRVDQSVLRILTLKLKIFNNTFSVTAALPNSDALNTIGFSSRVTFNIAQQAASLISPPLDELNNAIPSPPGRDDRIIFISDSRVFQQCSTCRQQYSLDVDAFKNAIIRLYSGSGQVIPNNLSSYTFQDLMDMLNSGTGLLQIENDLRGADWIVFAMDSVSTDVPVSQALRQFLDLRPDLIQGKHLIVFALSEPYALDATDISKLSAYYALYSRSSSFIEIAARILFHEIQPSGHLPVSVPGIGYEILEATSPDPNQVIHIYQDNQGALQVEGTQTPAPTPISLKIGDPISLVSGIILDHNGNQVPDGTVVRFTLYHDGDTVPAQIVESQTSQGIARGNLLIDQSGEINIRAESGSAVTSDVLTYEIPPESITSTPLSPTQTLVPSLTPTIVPTNTPTSTPQATVIPVNVPNQGNVDFGDWLVALIVTAIISGANYWLTNLKNGLRWGVRAALLPLISGMFTYIYLAINMPGSESMLKQMGIWGVMLFVIIGAGIGAGAVWIWQIMDFRNIKQHKFSEPG
jgi:beta-N-acetylhexosaminidase